MASSHPSLLGEIVGVLWRKLPKSILDVGMGFGKVGFLTREYLDVYFHRSYHKDGWKTRVDGVEIWPEFVTNVHRGLYDEIHIGNIIDVLPSLGEYDVIFIMDVIEHLSKEDGIRLLSLARGHAKTLVVSTPASHIDQGDILGNPYERHISDWTVEELGGECRRVGPMLVTEITGVDRRNVNIVMEGEPGWAVRHLSEDIFGVLDGDGRKVSSFDWSDDDDVSRVKMLASQDPSSRFYVSTGPAAEIIHGEWGIPREQMYFIFHSVDDILEFVMRFRGEGPPTFHERVVFLRNVRSSSRNEDLVRACSRYAGVGYLSVEQGDVLNMMGVTDAFHVPQYVNVNRFHPHPDRVDGDVFRVGAALNTISHPVRKGVPLLSEVIGRIRESKDMVFDARAIRGPCGARGLPYDDMPNYMNSIDVLICTAFSEGGPLPPLQAAACGVPTVSTRCGHMPELLRDGGGILVDDDVDSFMVSLTMLSSDRSLLRKMSDDARSNAVNNWSVESNGGGWIRMLDGLR